MTGLRERVLELSGFSEGKASADAVDCPRSASGLLPFPGSPCFAFAATYFWAKAAKSKQKPLFRCWLLIPDPRACRRLSLPDRKPVTQARSGYASSSETGSKVRYQLPVFVRGYWSGPELLAEKASAGAAEWACFKVGTVKRQNLLPSPRPTPNNPGSLPTHWSALGSLATQQRLSSAHGLWTERPLRTNYR